MKHDFLKAADAACPATNDASIMLVMSQGGAIEMTRDNKLMLERELTGTLENPLAALMSQVEIEYREMAATPARRESAFA